MYSHVVVGAEDIAIAKRFYDAIFSHMPLDEQGLDKLERPFYRQGKQRFISHDALFCKWLIAIRTHNSQLLLSFRS